MLSTEPGTWSAGTLPEEEELVVDFFHAFLKHNLFECK